MPQPPTLKIVEIFPSLQGEGLRQGEPTIFLRLAGCNLRCSFCDTKYAWREGRDMTAAEILSIIKRIRRRFPADWVCLTGGEPMLQDLKHLLRCFKKEGLKIQVETNSVLFQPLPVDWFTVSPKPKRYAHHPGFTRRAKEVKIVVTKTLSFAVIKRLRREFPAAIPLLLQPESNAPWSVAKSLRLVTRALRVGLKNVRVSVQLHKIYKLR
jgi:organic radical activating enzyme